MKNIKMFPFERNRYFYGKLLTVRDFETEQKYFNDKRRLLNRTVLGCGVVSGLQVTAIDDKTIYIEPGIALDDLGREIINPLPITQKLSLIDGFTNNFISKEIYLCMAYDEKGKEPIHALNNETDGNTQAEEYNRIYESNKIFIKETAEKYDNELNDITEETTVLYDDNKVRIIQIVPKFVEYDGILLGKLKIEKLIQVPKIQLDYQINLEGFLTEDDKNTIKVYFDEKEHFSNSQYEINFKLKNIGKIDNLSVLEIDKCGINLVIGDKQSNISFSHKNKIKIIDRKIKNEIEKSFFTKNLEESLQNYSDHCIHLAQISLVQAGPAFMIDKIVQNPFNEYVYNNKLLRKIANIDIDQKCKFSTKVSTETLPKEEKPIVDIKFSEQDKEFDFKFKFPEINVVSDNCTTGVIDAFVESKLLQNKSFFTGEISHGFGNEPVSIVLGLEQDSEGVLSEMDDYNQSIYYGDSRVFRDSPYEYGNLNVSLGAVVYPKKGTFRIGIKCLNGTSKSVAIRVRWWAFKANK